MTSIDGDDDTRAGTHKSAFSLRNVLELPLVLCRL